jgi:hypothetical protein
MAIPFNINPAITPIPAAAAWVYNQFVQTGNTHSNTTLDTLATGTSMLQVGQPVSGTGIAPGTTIASITNSTTVVLSIAATATGTGVTITFGSAPSAGSAFSNDAGWPVPISTAVDVPGCVFAIPEAQTLNAGSTFIPGPGGGFIALTSGTTAMTIQLQTGAGSWTSIFTGTASTTSYSGFIACDAGNVRINCPTTAGAFTFYRYRQMPVL